MAYLVVDGITGQVKARCSTRQKASHKRDKLDNEYGGYRYRVREE